MHRPPCRTSRKLTRFSDRPLQGRGKNGRSSAVSSYSWCSARPVYQCSAVATSSLAPLSSPRRVSRCSGLHTGIELLGTNQSLWKCTRPDFIWYVSGGVLEHWGLQLFFQVSSSTPQWSGWVSQCVRVCVYLLYQGVFCRGSASEPLTHTLSLQVHAQLICRSARNTADLSAAETRSRVRLCSRQRAIRARFMSDRGPATGTFFIELPTINAPPTESAMSWHVLELTFKFHFSRRVLF